MAVRRRAEQDGSGEVFRRKARRYERLEDYFEEEPGEGVHRERLYQPVHDERDDESLGLLARVLDAGEIHLEHHGIDHEPDEYRYGNGDLRILELV
jgi:hypothetical protein